MNTYKHLKNVLDYNIKKLAVCPSLFCENPETDFTRNRKLDFETIMKNIICMETGSLNNELLKLNDFFHSGKKQNKGRCFQNTI